MDAGADSADVVIVGAGAAGLMTAITAGRLCLGKNLPGSIRLLDSRAKIGAKILISGGTRCNVTNKAVNPSDYHGAAKHYLKHVFEAFTPDDTKRFFEEIGVTLVLEPTGKYFPTTHSGRTVLEALVKELERVKIPLGSGHAVESLEPSGDHFQVRIKTNEGVPKNVRARRVVLATGGLSLPETGSDGAGLAIAKKLGHTLVPTAPALTPLLSDDKDWTDLSGVSLEEVTLDFYLHGKKKASSQGGFLFTHFGFSGPAALDISRQWALADPEGRPQVIADFFPEKASALPKSLLAVLKRKFGLDYQKRLHQCSLQITGVYGYKKAEATAGGVDLKEVHGATLESKLVPGLFFAGEILDVDGRIGGFNFQWAWSSGVVAARGVIKGL